MFFVLRVFMRSGWAKEVYVAKVGETFITREDLKEFLKEVITSQEQLAQVLQRPLEHIQIIASYVEQKHNDSWQNHIDEIVQLALESRYEIEETSLETLIKKVVEN